MPIRQILLFAALAGLLEMQAAMVSAATNVGWIRIAGPIGPATSSYVARALDLSTRRGDTCLVIELDTPGGLLTSTEEIVKRFYASSIPVVVFVSPAGAMAGSAGCFITLAADVAAMATASTIGAAHPISMIPGTNQKNDDIPSQKMENMAIAFIEDIAQKRGRNAEWAKASVRDSAAITATQALQLNVIDLIARDRDDLLQQLEGREIRERRLATRGAAVTEIPMALRERVFQSIWRPEVILLLILVAIYGILGELNHPGTILPGVAGAIALILVLYLAAVLPINAAGLAMMLLALALFIVDIYAPTHGVLTFGGIAAFFLGGLMLFNRADPAFRLSVGHITAATLLVAVFFIFIAGAGLRAQRLPKRTGRESMPGQEVLTLAPVDAAGGRVRFEGESWSAVCPTPLAAGQRAEIVAVEGLTLRLKPKT